MNVGSSLLPRLFRTPAGFLRASPRVRALARWLLSGRVVSRTLGPTGHRVVFPASQHLGLTLGREIRWEPELTCHLKEWVPPGGIALDVGANIGIFTLLLLDAVGPSGFVWAFEPDPQNLPWLLCNLEANGAQQAVRVERVAASRSPGKLPLYQDLTTSRTSSLVPNAWHPDPAPVAEVMVETRPLDDYLNAMPRVDFIKIDTEGAELDVLEGSKRLLAKFRPTVLVEVIDRTWRDVAHLLESLGYHLTDPISRIELGTRCPGHILASHPLVRMAGRQEGESASQ